MIEYRVEFRAPSYFVYLEERGSRRILYLDTLKQLAKEEDREALAFLIPLHLRSKAGQNVETLSFQQIEISPKKFREVLPLLEKTSRLFYKNERRPVTEKLLEVFPQLILTDTTGCFANLWMDYPGVDRVAFDDLAPMISGRARLKETEASWERDLLEAGYLRKIVGNSHYYCPGDKTRATLLFLCDLGWQVFDAKMRRVIKQSSMNWELREERGAITVRGHAHFGEKRASLRSILRGNLWVELNDGAEVGLIDGKCLDSCLEGEWEGDALCLKRNSAGALLPLVDRPDVRMEESLRGLLEGLKMGEAMALSPPGALFRGKLLPYQQKGVNWLSFLHRWGFSGLLADEMGLGKTVQVLAFFSRLGTNLPILIVTPSSLLYQWRSEIMRFLPEAKVTVHAGPGRSKELPAGWIITSYAILRLDEELFSKSEFEAIVLDESNAIKTAGTQTAQAAYQLKGRFKVALSGTPVENRQDELVSQFRFIMPDLVQERLDLQDLRRKTRPFILRRRKEEVELDLPEKIEQIAWVEMHPEQEAIYQTYLSLARTGLYKQIEADGIQAHRMQMLEAILRLRQICCDPRLIGSSVEGSKIELCLHDLQGRKVLIYSQFTSMLQLIAQELRKEGREFLYLDGSVGLQQRADLVLRFQEDETVSLFLLSLKAGGVGLNLTAADYVLLFDPWWNESVEKQAIDRAHRIGQKRALIAKRYLVPNSIEEKMLRLKEEKRNVAEQLLEGEDFNWTEEDWLHLLS